MKRWPLIWLMAGLLAACSQPPVPQDHFYRLTATPPASTSKTPQLSGILEVSTIMADGVMAGRPIVFSDARNPVEVNEYHYHFWSEPPAPMMRDELVACLRAAGVATTIVTPELRIEPEFILSGRLKRLEQVRGTPTKAAIVLELGLRAGRQDKLLLLKTYRVENEAENDSVAAAVDAFNRALSAICARFVADIPAP